MEKESEERGDETAVNYRAFNGGRGGGGKSEVEMYFGKSEGFPGIDWKSRGEPGLG